MPRRCRKWRATAATKTLDGKTTKAITFAAKSSPQDNDSNFATDFSDLAKTTSISRPADMAKCPKTRCLFYSFMYKPAKGVKRGPLSVKISWTIPGQDYDLYVFQSGGDVGHCRASAGTSEVVVVDVARPGKAVKVVIDRYRSVPDTVTGKISFPAKDSVGTTAPSQPDNAGVPTNCGLS
ncbi:MAG: hypothetical protein QOJ03_1698 [Frankiaceae bacterium]|jgi:hypothetical protein|nr:hypothetical protein [Frankiaceae bacterium]